MSYTVCEMADGKFELVIQNGPQNCKALPMAPSSIENELQDGLWLLLVFAVWSIQDRNAINTALELGKRLGDTVRVGIRPFDEHQEISNWCPNATKTYQSPVWLVLKKGKLVKEVVGLYPLEQLEEEFRSLI